MEELERRIELAGHATTREEAAAAMAGLPPLSAEASPRPGASEGRRRGHGEAASPKAEWQPTAERFRDPRSGRIMRVWVDGAGGRHYVADDPKA